MNYISNESKRQKPKMSTKYSIHHQNLWANREAHTVIIPHSINCHIRSSGCTMYILFTIWNHFSEKKASRLKTLSVPAQDEFTSWETFAKLKTIAWQAKKKAKPAKLKSHLGKHWNLTKTRIREQKTTKPHNQNHAKFKWEFSERYQFSFRSTRLNIEF